MKSIKYVNQATKNDEDDAYFMMSEDLSAEDEVEKEH